jgi:predicted dehydrogenase
MKQVIRMGIRDIIVDDVPDPMVRPHHVLIRPAFSLISSGTETASIHQEGALKAVADNPSHLRKVLEVAKANGPLRTLAEVRAKFSEYAVLGYSGAGIVVDKHPTVKDLDIGERVAYGGEGTGHGETVLASRNLTAKLPDGVLFEHACFATLGSIALNAVRVAGIGLGETVAILGLGLVGQLIAQLARLQGGVVMAIDLKPERVEMARRLGAAHGVVGGAALADAVGSLTNGRGADCVIIAAAAKSSAPCLQALQICRDRGRLIVVGAVDMTFPWNDMYRKEVQVFMSRAYGPGSYDPAYEKRGQDYPVSYVRWTENRNMGEFLRLAGCGQVQVQPLVTHRFPLGEAATAYRTIMDPASGSLAVLLSYGTNGDQPPATWEPNRKVQLAAAAPAKSELGVALVGPGSLARWSHLPNLKKTPGARLRAIHSTSGVRGKSIARRFGADYCCTDYDEILRDATIDLVVITSRNQHHATQAVAALEAGKHVFVEKPMALTEEECRRLYRAVDTSGKQLTVGFNRRFAPFYVRLQQHLAGRTGPAVLNCRVNSPGISGAYWMADPSIGGAILGEACHFIDLMYWLLQTEPVSVSAFSLPTDRAEPVGQNNLVAGFRFADGSIGNLTYCTIGSRTSGGERVEAFAPGLGMVTEDFKTLTVNAALRRTSRRWWADKGYAAQLHGFVAGIRQGKAPAVTVLDGVRSTVGCLRMLEAARTGAACSIDLDAVIS